MKKYDVIIVGAGPGGIFSAYELVTNNSEIKVAVFEKGHLLEKRKCPTQLLRAIALFVLRTDHRLGI